MSDENKDIVNAELEVLYEEQKLIDEEQKQMVEEQQQIKDSKELLEEIEKEQEAINLVSEISDEKKDEEVIDQKKEKTYLKAVYLMKCMKCMAICSDKRDMYLKLAKQFYKLSHYKKSYRYFKTCKKLSLQTDADLKRVIYEGAKRQKKTARQASEFKSAAEEFRKANGFKDAEQLANECERLSRNVEKRTIWKRLSAFVFIILIIATILFGSSTSHGKYYIANAYMAIGTYSTAITMYEKLGAYKDCPERLQEAQYMYANELYKVEDYENAAIAYVAAGDYKDSGAMSVKMEQLSIINTKIGESIYIGKNKWTILAVEDNKALLMKTTSVIQAYHQVFEDVTWEKSNIREWLNTEFFNTAFSEAERSNIGLTNVVNHDNTIYGTDGGVDTQDFIFILSIEEANQYLSFMPDFKVDSWLRTPGFSNSVATFLSSGGTVMEFGYDITSDVITVHPVMWYNLQ